MKRFATTLGALAFVGSMAVSGPATADVSDAWITTKTKLSLMTSDGLHTTDVNVDTINGRVTLHGKVETAAEKSKAEEIARKVDGVKEVRNLIQVVAESREKAVDRSDDQIKEAVNEALEENAALEGSDIEVASVSKGVVLLNGTAETMSAHVDAVASARAVPGVTRVASEIKSPSTIADREIWREDVREAKSEIAKETKEKGRSIARFAKDTWITSDIKARLIADEQVPALDVNVDTRRGVVTLFGMVPTAEAKAAAEADVRKVDGVKSVNNDLQVVPKSQKEAVKETDEAVDKRVKAMLDMTPAFKDVHIEVKNGVVRLTGSIPTRTESMRVAIAVRAVDGVRSVQNDLRPGDSAAETKSM